MEHALKENIGEVERHIADACVRAGRPRSDVKLLAVSKTHPSSAIRSAIDHGIASFGENKVQEADGKIVELGRDAAEWHLIGHLQKNKARRAVQLFDVIQSVDSPELAERLERICIEEGRESLSVLAQVDLGGETTKAGISEADLPKLVAVLRNCERLRFDGLMTLPRYFEDAELTRPFFKRLSEIRNDLAADGAFANGFGHLSMGMSHDMAVAIEEGSTIVRIGTAIFGDRNVYRNM